MCLRATFIFFVSSLPPPTSQVCASLRVPVILQKMFRSVCVYLQEKMPKFNQTFSLSSSIIHLHHHLFFFCLLFRLRHDNNNNRKCASFLLSTSFNFFTFSEVSLRARPLFLLPTLSVHHNSHLLHFPTPAEELLLCGVSVDL